MSKQDPRCRPVHAPIKPRSGIPEILGHRRIARAAPQWLVIEQSSPAQCTPQGEQKVKEKPNHLANLRLPRDLTL